MAEPTSYAKASGRRVCSSSSQHGSLYTLLARTRVAISSGTPARDIMVT